MPGAETARAREQEAEQAPDAPAPAAQPPPHRILELQRSAGNAAVTRMLQREPVAEAPPAGTTDARAQAGALLPALTRERDDGVAALQKQAEASTSLQQKVADQADLIKVMEDIGASEEELLEARTDLVALKDKHAASEAERAALSGKVNKAESDLKLLEVPGASAAQLSELLARRGKEATAAGSLETSDTGYRLSDKGLVKKDETVQSVVAGGTSVVDKSATTTTIDTGSATRATTDTTTLTTGDKARSQTESNSTKLSWEGGNVGVTKAREEKREDTNLATGDSSSQSKSTSTTVGLGGYSKTVEDKVQTGDLVGSTKTTDAITRGDGKIGSSQSTTTFQGQVDPESGAPVKGTQKSAEVSSGYISGPDGVGRYAGAKAEVTNFHKKGVKTGGSAGVDGKWVANVREVKGDPPKYQLVITISIGGRLGVSGSAERETTMKGSQSASASGSVSGSMTATFVHTLSEADAEAYLKDIDAAAGGASKGTFKEMGILATLGRGGTDAARTMLKEVQAAAGSAAAIKEMKDGDAVAFAVEGKVEGKVGGGAKSGAGLGGSVELGGSTSGSVKGRIERRGGKAIITIEVANTDAVNAGATASMGAAGGGYSHAGQESETRTVSFRLDPDDPQYDAKLGQIRAVKTVAEARTLQESGGIEVIAYGEAWSKGETGTTKMNVGPASLSITGGSSYGEKTSVDEKGVVTKDYEGANVGGAGVEAFGMKSSASTEEKFAASVKDNRATADVTKTHTDESTSLTAWWEGTKQQPTAAITGGVKSTKTDVDVEGMKLSDDDFSTIVARAQNKREWERSVTSPRLIAQWEATRQAILEAGDDRARVAQALAQFVGKDGHKRAAAVEGLVRRPLGEGGSRYEWPSELSAHKGAYDDLVFGNPLADARELAKAGKVKEASAKLKALVDSADTVGNALKGGQEHFRDVTAMAEMVKRLNDRRAELSAEMKIIAARAATPAAGAKPAPPPVPEGVDYVPSAEQVEAQKEAERIKAKEKYDGLRDTFRNYKQQEMAMFAAIDAEYDKKVFGFIPYKEDIIRVIGLLNKILALHTQWRRDIAAYQEICRAHSWNGDPGPDQSPDKAKYDQYYARANRW